MKVHEILSNARTIQAERGHTKDTAEAPDGRVAISQALYLGGREFFRRNGTGLVMPQIARALSFEGWQQMVTWNNEPERTLEDVLGRLDQAIETTC